MGYLAVAACKQTTSDYRSHFQGLPQEGLAALDPNFKFPKQKVWLAEHESSVEYLRSNQCGCGKNQIEQIYLYNPPQWQRGGGGPREEECWLIETQKTGQSIAARQNKPKLVLTLEYIELQGRRGAVGPLWEVLRPWWNSDSDPTSDHQLSTQFQGVGFSSISPAGCPTTESILTLSTWK